MERTRDIGVRVFELRGQLGWSQMKLAKEAGVSHTTIVHVETGQVEPRLSTLRRLARGFGISVEELTGEGTPKLADPLDEASPAPADPEERRLVALIRPLVALMDEQAETWTSLARSAAVGSDGLHGEVVDKRRRVLEATEGVLESLSDEGLLDWHNPAHRPSRHARLELQAAFNRWTSAFFDVVTAHFEGPMGSEPESAEEKRLARWFVERRAS